VKRFSLISGLAVACAVSVAKIQTPADNQDKAAGLKNLYLDVSWHAFSHGLIASFWLTNDNEYAVKSIRVECILYQGETRVHTAQLTTTGTVPTRGRVPVHGVKLGTFDGEAERIACNPVDFVRM
jgi:hypothetical protein